MPESIVRIGTRSSELALRQAAFVEQALRERGFDTELVTYTTVGDRVLDRPLSAIGAKGLFTAELEADLIHGRIDCAVHSLKDLPTTDAAGLTIIALLEREDPRDALVVGPGLTARSLDALPPGTRVGTSSLRRRAQLRAMRPDVEVCELRGNVGTRLRKVDEGVVDAALLAAAGLKRLGLGDRIVETLDAPAWLAAPGQGAIAVQARLGDEAMLSVLRMLDHAETRVAVMAERALLAALEGGCQVPIGAALLRDTDASGHATGSASLHGVIAAVDGSRVVRGATVVDVANPGAAGKSLAATLLAAGGAEILAELRASSTSEPDAFAESRAGARAAHSPSANATLAPGSA
jgi:hydroxymethylbilane synthase